MGLSERVSSLGDGVRTDPDNPEPGEGKLPAEMDVGMLLGLAAKMAAAAAGLDVAMAN